MYGYKSSEYNSFVFGLRASGIEYEESATRYVRLAYEREDYEYLVLYCLGPARVGEEELVYKLREATFVRADGERMKVVEYVHSVERGQYYSAGRFYLGGDSLEAIEVSIYFADEPIPFTGEGDSQIDGLTVFTDTSDR